MNNCVKKAKIFVLETQVDSANLDNLQNDSNVKFSIIDTIYGDITPYKPIQYLNSNRKESENYTHKILVNYKDYFETGIQDLLINDYHYSIINFIIEHEAKKKVTLYCNKNSKLTLEPII